MAKAEEIAEPQGATAPQAQEKRSSGAPARMLIYFVVAVIIALALQKAMPALDIALSCHAKVVCSGVFVSQRPFEHVDISKVRHLLHPISCELMDLRTASIRCGPFLKRCLLTDLLRPLTGVQSYCQVPHLLNGEHYIVRSGK